MTATRLTATKSPRRTRPSLNVLDLAWGALAYRRFGEGEDLVLIHGLAANHGFWHLDILLPLAREYRVTVFDLRGHGQSAMPPSGYRAADMSADLAALIDALEIDQAHLVGHSIGGIVALEYAVRHPGRVASLTVADSRVRALQPVQRPEDWALWPVARARFSEVGLEVPADINDWGLWLLEQLARPEWREARARLDGTSLHIPFTRWGGGGQAAERWLRLLDTTTARRDFTAPGELSRESLATIRAPLLAIYGENSTTLDSMHGLARSVPGCQSLVVPGGDHFFPLTCAAQFVAALGTFLAALPPVTSLRNGEQPR